MKKCGQCKKNKNKQDFIKNGKDHKICNKCREYEKEYKKRERLKNPEKVLKRAKKYRDNNLDKIRKRDREWKKKYRDENPKEYKIKRLAYAEDNKDKLKEYDTRRIQDRLEYFLFSAARGRARKRKLEFNITERDVKDLLNTKTICPLRKIAFERGANRCAVDNSISLDRIDSTKGYIKNNIQIISYRANIIKNSCNIEEFEKIISNFRNFTPIKHDIDEDTIGFIMNERLKQIKNDNRNEKDAHRLLNIERWLINSAKKRIKKSKLDINIDKHYIKAIWPLDNKCPILEKSFTFGKGVSTDSSATLDRIDNTKGYIKGNVRVISLKANVVKNKATLEELEFILKNWKELENTKC